MVYCSFCAKSQDEVQALVAGPSAHICNECADLCVLVFAEKRGRTLRAQQDAEQLSDILDNGT